MTMRLLVFAGLLFAGAGAFAQGEPARADAITGIWKTQSGGYVQIYDAGDSYAGRIVGSVDGVAEYDMNNPDPDKRGRRLLGVVVIHGLQYEGDMVWGGGSIYDPGNGETYQLKAYLRAPDKLEVRGFIGFSLFGRSQMWTPVPLGAPNLEQDLLRSRLGQKAARRQPAAE